MSLGFCLAKNTLHLSGCIPGIRLAHTQLREGTCHGDGAYVVTGCSLDSDDVAYDKRQIGRIEVVSLSGVLELHFDDIAVGIRRGYLQAS